MPDRSDTSVDADFVVRRTAEQAAAALADSFIRIAVLEAQLADARTNRGQPATGPTE